MSAPPDLDRYLDEAADGLIVRNVGGGWFVATGANLQKELVVLAFRGSDSIGAIWARLAEAPSPTRIDPAGLVTPMRVGTPRAAGRNGTSDRSESEDRALTVDR